MIACGDAVEETTTSARSSSSGSASKEPDDAAEALRQRDRPVAAAVGDEHRRHAVRVEGARDLLGVLARADDHDVARRQLARPRARADSTATEATEALPVEIAVSVRTRLPVASAARKSLLVIGPVVRAASARS